MGIKENKIQGIDKQARISGIIIDFEKARREKKANKQESLLSLVKKELIVHVRRIAVIMLNILFNNMLCFWFIGKINKKLQFLHTIFVAYPASEHYTKAYVYPALKDKLKWSPWIAGVFRQNGKWGLMTIITSTDADFLLTTNETQYRLRELVRNVERKRVLLNAPQKSFAGIIPGVLHARGFVTETPETDVTVEVVLKAIDKLITVEDCPKDIPIIVLGGRGFVGRRLVKRLSGEVISIDMENSIEAWPHHLMGKKALLVNVTKKRAIGEYISKFWPELIILNETYPEPSKTELQAIARVGCNVYHIVGVTAKSYPSFPRVYYGGIPCCAAWNSPELDALIKKLK